MMRAIQIEGEVVAMVVTERGGKITDLRMCVVPLPYWRKQTTEQMNN